MRRLFDAMWHHAKHIKQREKKERVTFGVMTFVFSNNPYLWWSPAFLGVAEHLCLYYANISLFPMGSDEWISCSTLLLCAAITLPVKLTLIQPKSFLTFTLLIPTSIPAGVLYLAASWGETTTALLGVKRGAQDKWQIGLTCARLNLWLLLLCSY